MSVNLPFQPHQCPRCELRFVTRCELDDHVVVDHQFRPRFDTARYECIAARVKEHHDATVAAGR